MEAPEGNPKLEPVAEANSTESLDAPGTDDDQALETVTLKIRRRIAGRRLDKYLSGRFPRVSRTLIQKLIRQGEITVNGRSAKCSYEPDGGDVVAVRMPPPPTEIEPEDIPIEVIYEDEFILAINKHAGIICHPSRLGQGGTLANGLAFYAGENLSVGSDPFRPGIVHRLDKNTTGVMLVAKDDEAHWRLGRQFEERTIQKTYVGIVEGSPRLDGDIIDQPLAAHPMIRDRYLLPGLPARDMLFKEAVTRYQVVERFTGFALVHMFPKTGRTHQLRVHMSAIGHPMLGDTFYGGHFISEREIAGSGDEEPLMSFQSLHAFRIEFKHPITSKPMCIEAPLPANMQRVLDLLRAHRKK